SGKVAPPHRASARHQKPPLPTPQSSLPRLMRVVPSATRRVPPESLVEESQSIERTCAGSSRVRRARSQRRSSGPQASKDTGVALLPAMLPHPRRPVGALLNTVQGRPVDDPPVPSVALQAGEETGIEARRADLRLEEDGGHLVLADGAHV